jgi:aspartyl-tRNA(Asn)/glutamyl-tRNA(Gln) amidotransferase subunit A
MYQQSRAESFGMPAKAYIFQGAYFQFENYGAFENACRIRARLLCEVAACFDRVDLLVLPTRRSVHNAAEAGTIEEIYDAFSLTLLASVTGQPAVQLPGWVLDDGTDLGLQLVGPRLADVRLLSIATRLCRSTRGAV